MRNYYSPYSKNPEISIELGPCSRSLASASCASLSVILRSAHLRSNSLSCLTLLSLSDVSNRWISSSTFLKV